MSPSTVHLVGLQIVYDIGLGPRQEDVIRTLGEYRGALQEMWQVNASPELKELGICVRCVPGSMKYRKAKGQFAPARRGIYVDAMLDADLALADPTVDLHKQIADALERGVREAHEIAESKDLTFDLREALTAVAKARREFAPR